MHSLILTPDGFSLAGVMLARRAPDGTLAFTGREGRIRALLTAAYGPLPLHAMNYIRRASELLRHVKASDWNDRTPHRANYVRPLARAYTMLSLTGLNGAHETGAMRMRKSEVLLDKGILPEMLIAVLEKDIGDDSGDDESEDDSSDSGSDFSDGGDSGGGHYNPDEPRIPAGQQGGGQWTTADGGTASDRASIPADDTQTTPDTTPSSTREYQVAQRTDVMTDATPAGNANSATAQPAATPSANMNLSSQGVDFIAQHEGFRDEVYQDTAGLDTIGYGHRVTPDESYPDGITQPQATQLLAQDTATAQAAVRDSVTANLTQEQFDALVSFAYNVGTTAFANSTLVQHINDGDNAAAAAQFDRWNRTTNDEGQRVVDPGLANRRTAERNLFQNGNY